VVSLLSLWGLQPTRYTVKVTEPARQYARGQINLVVAVDLDQAQAVYAYAVLLDNIEEIVGHILFSDQSWR
jgi:hypothetical protein